MSRFFVPSSAVANGGVTITGQDARHIALSLRMRTGEELTVCDGTSAVHLCRIDRITPDAVYCTVLSTDRIATELPCRVRLYMSIPKADKMELIIQKATELGVWDIIPVKSSRCISRPDDKALEKKLSRWNSIAREAAMQSGRGHIPTVHSPVDFSKAVAACGDSLKLFCYEGDCRMKLADALGDGVADISVFVGPEGGYSLDEAALAEKHGFITVNLGPRILRCETAPLYFLSAISYRYELI